MITTIYKREAAAVSRALWRGERSTHSTSATGQTASSFAAGHGGAHHSIKAGAFVVTAPHTRQTKNTERDYTMSHAVYTNEEVEAIQQTHYEPQSRSDRAALGLLGLVRRTFDRVTGYGNNMTADKYLTRMIFLETVAGIPGMVGAMVRHLQSLRTMRRDNGWVHTLLEEAENERMHLLTFLELKKPGAFMRLMVLGAQGVMVNGYFLAYLLAPSACHRFVGFLEEEAVHTYTKAIADVEAGRIPEWTNAPAPPIGISYWRLQKDAKMADLLKAIRADEAIHRDVNHVLASLEPTAKNPFF